MRIALFLLIFFFESFGCTGDCLTCHPALIPTIEDDERHKPMRTCIKCHSAEASKMAECGSDCFACHPISKINGLGIKEHDVIQGCRDCHVELKKQLFGIPEKSQSTLKQTLFNLD